MPTTNCKATTTKLQNKEGRLNLICSMFKLNYGLSIAFILAFLWLPLKTFAVNTDSLLQISKLEKDPKLKSDKYLDYLSKLNPVNRDSAMDLLNKCIADYKQKGFDYGYARALSIKSWFLLYASKYEESLKGAHEALSIQTKLKDSLGIALSLNRIAICNQQFNRFADAEKYYLKAFNYFNKLKDSARLDMTLNNLGVLAFNQNFYPKAISFYRQSLAIRVAQKRYYWVAYAQYNIGSAFLEAGNIDSASFYLLNACDVFLHKSTQAKIPAMVLVGVADLYNRKKQYQQALTYLQDGIKTAIEGNHTEIELQGKAMLGSVLYNLNRFKEAYEAETEYLELKTSVDSMNNAASVAEVEAKYKTAEKEAEIANLKAQKLKAENKVQSLRIVVISTVAGLLLLVAFIVLIWQRRNQKEKIKVSELNAKIAEAKMFALRAQMNPHFIFNCINTAQNFVMHDQREQAHEYLTNFAKLLRLVMENSSKTFVELEDEISQLELYVQLEAIRFQNKFTYTIEIDEALKNGVFEIPGMCMQPLVENAIGHGLINRNDNAGNLQIQLKQQDGNVVCTIIDNGVGRLKAAEIKAAKNTRYQSTAIPNISERLKMLQFETGKAVSLEITDLTENGLPSGTKAVLILPCQ